MLTRKLGRKRAHRNHLMRNLAASLLLYERVETTEAKSKEVKRLIDHSICLAKKNSLAARRQLAGLYFDQKVVAKLFEVLVGRFHDRQSGFTKIVSTGNRVGDGANRSLITLVGFTKAEIEPLALPAESPLTPKKLEDHDHAD